MTYIKFTSPPPSPRLLELALALDNNYYATFYSQWITLPQQFQLFSYLSFITLNQTETVALAVKTHSGLEFTNAHFALTILLQLTKPY